MSFYLLRIYRYPLLILLLAGLIACFFLGSSIAENRQEAPLESSAQGPRFGRQFWSHWSDGQAELAAYDLSIPRYGQLRSGTAVSIFVTETFSKSQRVKTDRTSVPSSDKIPVMKLNLIYDFPTGIYDYNLMSSSFVALQPFAGRPTGSPVKISFSSQEWCGHVWQQLLFNQEDIHYQLHSYFENEGDAKGSIDYPSESYVEELLFHWARGFAAPLVKPGTEHTVRLLSSLKTARFSHQDLLWKDATLRVNAQTEEIEVPAGTFEVRKHSAIIRNKTAQESTRWTFFVEEQAPQRIIKWQTSTGEKAELISSARLKYWKMNENSFQSALGKLGLHTRSARTM